MDNSRWSHCSVDNLFYIHTDINSSDSELMSYVVSLTLTNHRIKSDYHGHVRRCYKYLYIVTFLILSNLIFLNNEGIMYNRDSTNTVFY